MTIEEHTIQGATILELHGELNFSSRQDFMAAIRRTTRRDHAHVIVDLQGITSADDSALSLLVIAHQKLIQHHHRLSLLNPSERLAGQLRSTKFPRVIPLFFSLEEALKRKGSPFTLIN